MAEEKKPQVFLSYASENLDMVRKVYEGLVKRNLNVWFDKEHLVPGKWKAQIERAIRRSRYFIICLSNAAIKKTGDEPGFQDHELNEAYEIAMNQPEHEFTIIPVRIENCHRGDNRLSLFQQYDLVNNFEQELDMLAIHLGGASLSDPKERDRRTNDEKIVDSILAKANTEYYAGSIRDSIILYDSMLILSPNDMRALFNKGTALGRLGKFEDAIEAFDQVLKIAPNDIDTWTRKGAALGHLGKFVEAIAAFERSLNLKPDDAYVWVEKGIALGNLGQLQEAITAFQKAVKIQLDNSRNLAIRNDSLSEAEVIHEALMGFEQVLTAFDQFLRDKVKVSNT